MTAAASKNLTRPGSLADVEERFRVCVGDSQEPVDYWREVLGWSSRRFTALLTGRRRGKTTGRLTARALLCIDDACGEHFLTPPERRWAKKARRRRPQRRPKESDHLMLKNITITFDELERRLFDTVASPSILGGPEQDEKGPYPWTRLVRRAAQGEALSGVELAALKKVLEDSTAERETNVASAREAGNADLASGFETWLDPLGEAWGLVCQAEAVALGGAQ